MNNKQRIKEAIEIGLQYGQVDGSHHKMWVIDQMICILANENYDAIIEEACKIEDEDFTDEWDCGVAP